MAVDAFLKIEGITGEHKGEIQLETFSWGVSNTVSHDTGGGGGAGKPVFQDFTFTSHLGQQSPELFMHAVQGTNLRTADLTINGGRRQVTISFFDVFISGYKEDAMLDKSSSVPLEMVSLNFAQVQIKIGGQVIK